VGFNFFQATSLDFRFQLFVALIRPSENVFFNNVSFFFH
jgi:hypothetical protein